MIDKLDEGERLEKGVEKQNIHYSDSNYSDKLRGQSPFKNKT